MYAAVFALALFLLAACGMGTVFVEELIDKVKLIITEISLFTFFAILSGALLWGY